MVYSTDQRGFQIEGSIYRTNEALTVEVEYHLVTLELFTETPFWVVVYLACAVTTFQSNFEATEVCSNKITKSRYPPHLKSLFQNHLENSCL